MTKLACIGIYKTFLPWLFFLNMHEVNSKHQNWISRNVKKNLPMKLNVNPHWCTPQVRARHHNQHNGRTKWPKILWPVSILKLMGLHAEDHLWRWSRPVKGAKINILCKIITPNPIIMLVVEIYKTWNLTRVPIMLFFNK